MKSTQVLATFLRDPTVFPRDDFTGSDLMDFCKQQSNYLALIRLCLIDHQLGQEQEYDLRAGRWQLVPSDAEDV